MKKIVSILLTLAMVLSLVPAVFTADEPTITMSADKTSVAPGETVTLTVSLDKDTVVDGAGFKIDFDKEAYEYVKKVPDTFDDTTNENVANAKDDRPNLVYPVYHNGVEIYPDKQWIWEKSRLYQAIENDEVVFSENSGKWSVRFKQYLKDENGVMCLGKPISILTGPYNQDGTKEIETIFGKKVFNNPKPKELIKYLLSFVFDGKDDKDGIYLDSFGGSGTTAHAVLDLNRDGGNRKFILVEMGDYADSITAERVKRVIRGYGEGKNAVEGTGGNFSFYDLGEPLLVGDCLNEAVAPEKIREYIWFMETKQPYAPPSGGNPYYLGQHNNTGYYFYYEPQRVTVLDYTFLATITEKTSGTIIYADRSSITEDKLAQMGIVFKKIPRDISRL